LKFAEIRGAKNPDGTHKQYVCHDCSEPIFYASFFDDAGNLYTTDGQKPNGKWGKESNVKGYKVDINKKDVEHKCNHSMNESTQGLIDKSQLITKDSKDPVRMETTGNPKVNIKTGEGMSETYRKSMEEHKVKTMSVVDFASDGYTKERIAELELIELDEKIIRDFLIKGGDSDPNPQKVGLWHKILEERMKK